MAKNWTWNHYARVTKDGRVIQQSLENPTPWSQVRESEGDGWALIVEQ